MRVNVIISSRYVYYARLEHSQIFFLAKADFRIASDMGAFRVIFDWFNERGFRQGFIDSYANKIGAMIRRSLQLYV
jgi:hypothetical protein